MSQLEFKCSRKDLLEGLHKVSVAVSNRSSLPILSHVLIDGQDGTNRVQLQTCNLEIGVKCVIEASIKSEGQITVPVQSLMQLVTRFNEGNIEISGDTLKKVHIKSQLPPTGVSHYKLLGFDPAEYPNLPEVNSGSIFKLPQEILQKMLQLVLIAVAKQESRVVLTGVLFEIRRNEKREVQLKLVSTDTHRLIVVETSLGIVENYKIDEEGHFIVPGNALIELLRLFTGKEKDVDFQFGNGQVIFRLSDETIMIARLIEGQFPRYEEIIPSEHSISWCVNRNRLLSAISRANIVARGDSNRIVLHGETNLLTLIAKSHEIGLAQEQLDISVVGNDIVIGINGLYIAEILAEFKSEECTIEINGALKALIIRPCFHPRENGGGTGDESSIDSNYFCLIMPMEVS